MPMKPRRRMSTGRAPPPTAPERPDSSRGDAPTEPDPAADPDADGWLSDVSDAEDDAKDDAAAWADTSVEIEKSPRRVARVAG